MGKQPQIRFRGFSGEWRKSQLKQEINYSSTGMRACDIDESGKYDLYDANSVIGRVNSYASVDPYISLIKDGSGVGRVRLLPGMTNCIGTMGVITPKELNDVGFIFSHLQTKDFKQHVISGAIPHVYFKDYGEDIVILPLSNEQKAIGDFFRELNSLIDARQEELDKLRQMKSSLLEQMFPAEETNVPSVRFRGFSAAWERLSLGKMGSTYTGLSGKSKSDFGHGKAKYVTYMNVFTNTIASPEGTDFIEVDSRQNQVKYGDVLFTTSSETPDEVGMSSVWLCKDENVYLNSFCFGFRPNLEIYPYYLAYALRTPRIRRCFYLLAQGISRFNISKQKAMEIELDIPTYEEQRKIGDFFKELDAAITADAMLITKLKLMKQALLEKMLVK